MFGYNHGVMPDYNHPLRFGSFITPRNQPPHHPVDLAMYSEDVGLDLVTFQDHPYQAVFHDTWTLLAWVAARTSPGPGRRPRCTSQGPPGDEAVGSAE
jgi:hypothetical protein